MFNTSKGPLTSTEWNERWVWPIGTKVTLVNHDTGVVTKENSTTVNVVSVSGREYYRVPKLALTRSSC